MATGVFLSLLQVCAAFCTVLASVLARMPSATLRSKFGIASGVLCTVLEQHRDDVRAMLHLQTPCSLPPLPAAL